MRPTSAASATFTYLPIDSVQANPLNPRKVFDPDALAELADSIASYGVIQPLVVHRQNSHYVLICGERRLRAAKQAKLLTVPAIVHEDTITDEAVLCMALVENLQRKDVDIISESAAIRRLVEEHDWTQMKLAEKMGVSQGYVRNRVLLTKYADVLQIFSSNTITLSQALELAAVESLDSRKWILERIQNGEFQDIKELNAAVKRDRLICSVKDRGVLSLQRLDRTHVQFDVDGLPYCDTHCPHYLRVSWAEKQRYGIDQDKPGWSEFCSEECGKCFQRKLAAKQQQIKKLKSIAAMRPIPDDGTDSMLWFMYKKQMCRTCKYMVENQDLQKNTGAESIPHYQAVCTHPTATCFKTRVAAFERTQKEGKLLSGRIADTRRQKINDQSQMCNLVPSGVLRAGLTKHECTYLILQYLCYAGGKQRLEAFAKSHKWGSHLPSRFTSQIKYVRNKLLKAVHESDLMGILFAEAAASAAYSEQDTEPLCFDRKSQVETPMVF